MEYSEYIEKIVDLGRAGRLVFPAVRDKKPIISGWPQLAASDESQLRAWFSVNQPPNPAVVTGHKLGFFCLDVDGDEGKASLAALEEQHGQLARECVSRTPSDGLHIYFKMPDFDLRNSASKLGPKLDIRANGGYVLVPLRRRGWHPAKSGRPFNPPAEVRNKIRGGHRGCLNQSSSQTLPPPLRWRGQGRPMLRLWTAVLLSS